MKKTGMRILLSLLFCMVAISAHALSFTFSDKDFLGGASWGTMDILQIDSDTLKVQYTASTTAVIPAGAQVTGFGFNLANTSFSVTNPLDNAFANDLDGLDWVKLDNLNAIPNPANGDEFNPALTKANYNSGATEGNANNFSPPGILPGQLDIFYLNFSGQLPTDLTSLVLLTGIRLQSLPENINGGSLFLAGGDPGTPPPNPVPEPATMLLLGSGLLGLAGCARRKFKK